MRKIPTSYETAIFVCTHKRPDDYLRPNCADRGGPELLNQLRNRVRSQGLDGKIRICASSCLGYCDEGPLAVTFSKGELILGISTYDFDEILKDLSEED